MVNIEEVEKKIEAKGHPTNWSICKITLDNEIMFRFRVLGCVIQEGIGTTLEEAINDYLVRLPEFKK
jgi:hypothetical protein